MSQRTIVVTKQDYERLTRLLEIYGSGREADAFAVLEEELSRAQVVESTAAPPDVVTMNSRVRFRDTDTGEEFEVTLVYPKAANASEGKISVIAPVGSALLGLSVGQSIKWPVPGGKQRNLCVTAVIYQPEAAGDFDL